MRRTAGIDAGDEEIARDRLRRILSEASIRRRSHWRGIAAVFDYVILLSHWMQVTYNRPIC